MIRETRNLLDQSFTAMGYFSIAIMAIVLLIVLAPIIIRGLDAYFFQETVEFRRMLDREFIFPRYAKAYYHHVNEQKGKIEALKTHAKEIHKLRGEKDRIDEKRGTEQELAEAKQSAGERIRRLRKIRSIRLTGPDQNARRLSLKINNVHALSKVSEQDLIEDEQTINEAREKLETALAAYQERKEPVYITDKTPEEERKALLKSERYVYEMPDALAKEAAEAEKMRQQVYAYLDEYEAPLLQHKQKIEAKITLIDEKEDAVRDYRKDVIDELGDEINTGENREKVKKGLSTLLKDVQEGAATDEMIASLKSQQEKSMATIASASNTIAELYGLMQKQDEYASYARLLEDVDKANELEVRIKSNTVAMVQSPLRATLNELLQNVERNRKDWELTLYSPEYHELQNMRGEQIGLETTIGVKWRHVEDLKKRIASVMEMSDTIEKIETHLAGATYDADVLEDLLKSLRKSGLRTMKDAYKLELDSPDLQERQNKYDELESMVWAVIGPDPKKDQPVLLEKQFGQTRWDRAQVKLHKLLYEEVYVSVTNKSWGKEVVERVAELRPRKEHYAGTPVEPIFAYMEENLEDMLRPRMTMYCGFLYNKSKADHFFGGIGSEVRGTLLLTIGAIVFAVPIGIIAAIYLCEYAKPGKVITLIRTCISTLAGVPSIVFGLFGLAFFLNAMNIADGHKSIISGSLTLALMILPTVIRASEEAILAVPKTYKEAAMGLGAGRWYTVCTVILPASLPGILTGIVISMGRAAGETAPIIFTAAVSLGEGPANIFKAFFEPTKAMPWNIYNLCTEHEAVDEIRHVQFGMVLTLVAVVLLLNIVAIIMRARISKKLRG